MKQENKNASIISSRIVQQTWYLLSDYQKAILLLNTPRLLDAQSFLQEFQSFEAPIIESKQKLASDIIG